jgi:hypothetical protein
MAQTEFDRVTRVMLGEFARVHERLQEHDDHFESIGQLLEVGRYLLADHLRLREGRYQLLPRDRFSSFSEGIEL